MKHNEPIRVVIALGSNLEPRRERMQQAVAMLEQEALFNVQRSLLYTTEPVGHTSQPEFLNAVIAGDTIWSAADIHALCKDIERRIGRQLRPRWHEREIDIDVLLYGDAVIATPTLSIPHPRMHERAFVLVPACDVAATMIHPLFGVSLATLLANCSDPARVAPAEEPAPW